MVCLYGNTDLITVKTGILSIFTEYIIIAVGTVIKITARIQNRPVVTKTNSFFPCKYERGCDIDGQESQEEEKA